MAEKRKQTQNSIGCAKAVSVILISLFIAQAIAGVACGSEIYIKRRGAENRVNRAIC